jgi:hypothetical protein
MRLDNHLCWLLWLSRLFEQPGCISTWGWNTWTHHRYTDRVSTCRKVGCCFCMFDLRKVRRVGCSSALIAATTAAESLSIAAATAAESLSSKRVPSLCPARPGGPRSRPCCCIWSTVSSQQQLSTSYATSLSTGQEPRYFAGPSQWGRSVTDLGSACTRLPKAAAVLVNRISHEP